MLNGKGNIGVILDIVMSRYWILVFSFNGVKFMCCLIVFVLIMFVRCFLFNFVEI